MCNLYTQTRSVDAVAALFRDLQMPLDFPDGIPNLQPRDVAITDLAPIVRERPGKDGFELVVRRWSWPGPSGKPVYNFRSDGRDFPSGRCLVLADGFYEFTAPADPRQKRKDRWLFSAPDGAMLGIAGIVRNSPQVGEAFTMLTTGPGADVAEYHGRQVAVIAPAGWRAWLGHHEETAALIGPLPEGSLKVGAAPR